MRTRTLGVTHVPGPKPPTPCSPYGLLLQEIDTDRNGLIDYDEFLEWIVEKKQTADLVVRANRSGLFLFACDPEHPNPHSAHRAK